MNDADQQNEHHARYGANEDGANDYDSDVYGSDDFGGFRSGGDDDSAYA